MIGAIILGIVAGFAGRLLMVFDLGGLLSAIIGVVILLGQVQMTVRAYYAGDALLQAAVAGDEEIARRRAELDGLPELEARAERMALGEQIAAAVDARRAHDEEALAQRLRPLASDVRIEDADSERVALKAQLLVRRDRREALDAAIAELGNALEGYLALRYLGPLPPYSFAALELEEAGAT